MDKQLEILLNQYQNVESVNVDEFNKIELHNKISEINQYDKNYSLSSTEIYDTERDVNSIYRIYGRIEYMSILNGLKNKYSLLEDFFKPQKTNSKNIFNSFDFYLVKPSTVQLFSNNDLTIYKRYFEVIATPNDFDLYSAGYSNNVFGEDIYAFNLNKDIDISNKYDGFGFPITELYLYPQYKKYVSFATSEVLSATTWLNDYVLKMEVFNTKNLNIGDLIESANGFKFYDIIKLKKQDYSQSVVFQQIFYINTPFIYESEQYSLIWKYNPLIPIKLRNLTDVSYTININSTSYDIVESIPPYALEFPENTGNYVWRDVMPEGYIDPLTNIGTNHPFMNGRRYAFNPIVFDIIPDMNDYYTNLIFNDVYFGKNSKIDYKTSDNLDKIGAPCQ